MKTSLIRTACPAHTHKHITQGDISEGLYLLFLNTPIKTHVYICT